MSDPGPLRPMPGPPECLPNGFPHDGVAIDAPACLLHAWIDRDWGKHLTDAECAAEYWRASYDLARPLAAGCVTPSADWLRGVDEAATWHRFAAHPHANQETQ